MTGLMGGGNVKHTDWGSKLITTEDEGFFKTKT